MNSTWTNFEVHLSNLETKLTNFSGYTLGLIPAAGPLKVLIGAVQVVAALILCGIGLMTQDQALMQCTFVHIQHGFGNILAGIIETIPLIATISMCARDYRTPLHFISGTGVNPSTEDYHKYMPYESVAKRQMVMRVGSDIFDNGLDKKTKEANLQFKKLSPTDKAKDDVSKVMEETAEDCIKRANFISLIEKPLAKKLAENHKGILYYSEEQIWEALLQVLRSGL